jgi:hypothetical protein
MARPMIVSNEAGRELTDPVCGMRVSDAGGHRYTHENTVYYFCSDGSRKPTENGKFHLAAQGFKAGRRGTEVIKVYEKIKSGI